MLFKFKNLGAIKEAEIEMGNLTIISGKNNTGKTYLTYSVLDFLKNWLDYLDTYKFKYINIEEIANQILIEEKTTKLNLLDIDKEIKTISKFISNKFIESQKNENFIFSFDFQFDSEKNYDKKWQYSYYPFIFEKKQNSRDISIKFKKKSSKKDDKENNKKDLSWIPMLVVILVFASLVIQNKNNNNNSEPDNKFIKDIAKKIFEKEYFSNIFTLSAERTPTYFFSKEILMLRNEVIKNKNIKILENVSNLPSSIEDQITFINSISKIEKNKSFLWENHSDVIEYIEKHILKVNYIMENEEPKINIDGKPISYYQVSTSIRSLSDLNFWLKHKVQEGNLLIIDEPELNLHPENQIKIARLLVKLVNAGIKVWITTHSDYIIKEINNCLLLSNDFFEKEELMEEYSYKENDILKKEDIRVYIAKEDGNIEQVEIGTLGMKKTTFDEAIQRFNEVSDILFNILD